MELRTKTWRWRWSEKPMSSQQRRETRSAGSEEVGEVVDERWGAQLYNSRLLRNVQEFTLSSPFCQHSWLAVSSSKGLEPWSRSATHCVALGPACSTSGPRQQSGMEAAGIPGDTISYSHFLVRGFCYKHRFSMFNFFPTYTTGNLMSNFLQQKFFR